MRQQRVLIVDDEVKIRRLVRSYLEAEGFSVSEAETGEVALDQAATFEPDLVLLDIMLPGIDGVEVLRRLRTRSDVYVILVSARAEELDKLIGLSVGADDYVTKPFSPRELVARVKTVLRRARDAAPVEPVIRVNGLEIDPARRVALRQGRALVLTALEFDLLNALASSPDRVYSRRQLLERVWGSDFYGDERVVDVHIANVRKALGDRAEAPAIIATVRGVGYKLMSERPR